MAPVVVMRNEVGVVCGVLEQQRRGWIPIQIFLLEVDEDLLHNLGNPAQQLFEDLGKGYGRVGQLSCCSYRLWMLRHPGVKGI